jgi:hypothetical protein
MLMRIRTIATAVALGICLGLSTVPAQAGLTSNGLTFNGWANGLTLPLPGGAQVASPGVPNDSLPFHRLSQQGIGTRQP